MLSHTFEQTESYKMIKHIDDGAFASVFQVIHKPTKKVYALKMAKAKHKETYVEKQLEQQVIFHAIYLPNHPNILRAFDIFKTQRYVCFVMDYCTCTLDDIIKMDTPLWFKMRVARQLTAGLDALFERSILHRDLKPKNILITGQNLENYQVRITDFGLAKRLDPDQLLAKSSVGTPLYMAPQILANKEFTQQVDVWALGCLIYTLFTKTPPFNARSLAELVEMLNKGEYTFPKGTKIPFEAIVFIDKCLKRDQSKRKHTFELLVEDLLTNYDEKAMTKAKILDYMNLKLNTNRDNSEFLMKTQNTDYSTYKNKKY